MDSKILHNIKDFITSNEGKKEFVDPFAVFAFAGKKVKIYYLKKKQIFKFKF